MADEGDRLRRCRECDQPAQAPRLLCRDCRNAQNRAYYAANREKVRAQQRAQYALDHADRPERPRKLNRQTTETIKAAHFRRNYGISACEVAEMTERQAGCCAICGQPADLVVDHDHDTGRTRALLCQGCNLGLGQFQDDPERLMAAAAYLLQFQEVIPVGRRG
jgi:hypothetical protein